LFRLGTGTGHAAASRQPSSPKDLAEHDVEAGG
jgi:hypothetical protein